MTDNAIEPAGVPGGSGTVALGASALLGASPVQDPGPRRPIVIASGNGMKAIEKAMELLKAGADPLDAAIAGVAIVEADPERPDRRLRRHPQRGRGRRARRGGHARPDARRRRGRVDPEHHAPGGRRPAGHEADRPLPPRRRGGPEVRPDARLPRGEPPHRGLAEDLAPLEGDQRQGRRPDPARPTTNSTRSSASSSASASTGRSTARRSTPTATSAARRPRRGCSTRCRGGWATRRSSARGCYLDNEVGSAGSTGRGEANLLNLSSFAMVEFLRRGMDPKDAALEACRRVVATNKTPRLRDRRRAAELQRLVLLRDQGRPLRRGARSGRAGRSRSTTATRPGRSTATPSSPRRCPGPDRPGRRNETAPRGANTARGRSSDQGGGGRSGQAGGSAWRCFSPSLDTM